MRSIFLIQSNMQIGEQFFRVKNKNLKFLNLMKNKLTLKCFDNLVHIIQYNEDLQISMDDNVLSSDQMYFFNDKKGKFSGRIYFSKH